MDLKKLGKALLFPPTAVLIPLIPVSAALLVLAMLMLGTRSFVACLSYALAAYTLTAVCARIPRMAGAVRRFLESNRHARRWREDARLRVNVSLYASLCLNALFGIFQLGLGLYHRTFWFTSLGAYYICLGLMRFFLVGHTRKYAPGEKMASELRKYRACGWVLLLMNLALSLIIFFMVYRNRSFHHHMITAITMAAYTFTAFTLAIVNVVKYKKYRSPVFSASKAIGLAAALVSMLTLESTMLTTFADGSMTPTARKWMLGATGGVIAALIVAMAIGMIAAATGKLNALRSENTDGTKGS